MTTETLLNERIKELEKSKHDLKLVSIKYQEVKSKLVCVCCKMCSHVPVKQPYKFIVICMLNKVNNAKLATENLYSKVHLVTIRSFTMKATLP